MNYCLLWALLVSTLIKTGRVVKRREDSAVAHDIAILNDFKNSIKLLLKSEKRNCESQCLNQMHLLRRISELRSAMMQEKIRNNCPNNKIFSKSNDNFCRLTEVSLGI